MESKNKKEKNELYKKLIEYVENSGWVKIERKRKMLLFIRKK